MIVIECTRGYTQPIHSPDGMWREIAAIVKVNTCGICATSDPPVVSALKLVKKYY